jgi:hypothetical protein
LLRWHDVPLRRRLLGHQGGGDDSGGLIDGGAYQHAGDQLGVAP